MQVKLHQEREEQVGVLPGQKPVSVRSRTRVYVSPFLVVTAHRKGLPNADGTTDRRGIEMNSKPRM